MNRPLGEGKPAMDSETIVTLAVVAVLALIALAVIFHRLRVRVKKGDLDVSIAGDKQDEASAASGPPTAAPASFDQRRQTVQNQTNIAGDQYGAGRDISHVEESQSQHHNVFFQINHYNYYSAALYGDAKGVDHSACIPASGRVVTFTRSAPDGGDATKTAGSSWGRSEYEFDVVAGEMLACLEQLKPQVRSGELDPCAALEILRTTLVKAIADHGGPRQ